MIKIADTNTTIAQTVGALSGLTGGGAAAICVGFSA